MDNTIDLIKKIKYQRLTPIQKIFIDVFNNCFVVNQDNSIYYVWNKPTNDHPFYANGFIIFEKWYDHFLLSEYSYWNFEYYNILMNVDDINDEIKKCLKNCLNISVNDIYELDSSQHKTWTNIEKKFNNWNLNNG